jgi:hypothetical protein
MRQRTTAVVRTQLLRFEGVQQALLNTRMDHFDPESVNLGQRVAHVRTKVRHLEQRELLARMGEAVKMSQQALSALETRDSKTSEFAVELADALQVSVRWLLTGRGPMRRPSGPSVSRVRDSSA